MDVYYTEGVIYFEDMAQAQIDALELRGDGPKRPRHRKAIRCEIDQHLHVTLKTVKKKPVFVLAKGSNTMQLSCDTLERLCAAKPILSLLYQESLTTKSAEIKEQREAIRNIPLMD